MCSATTKRGVIPPPSVLCFASCLLPCRAHALMMPCMGRPLIACARCRAHDVVRRCAELEAKINDIEEKRLQQVAALEAEKAAFAARSEQLAAELDAARHGGQAAGTEDRRCRAEEAMPEQGVPAARGVGELGELGELLAQSAPLLQALGPLVSQHLTDTLLGSEPPCDIVEAHRTQVRQQQHRQDSQDEAAPAAAAAAPPPPAVREEEQRARIAGEFLSACLRRVQARTWLEGKRKERERRERRVRERKEAAAAAERQREEAQAAAARAAASLKAKEEAAAAALAAAAAAAQAESMAQARAAAAAAAANKAADDAAQAARAKALASVELEEHSRECERAATAAEVAAAQAAAALERSQRDDSSDDASSVYAEDCVVREERGAAEPPVSEEALDALCAEVLQQAQLDLELDRHAERICYAVIANAVSQLGQEYADACTYQAALAAVTPVKTDATGDARAHPADTRADLADTRADLADAGADRFPGTPSRHVRFSDENCDLSVAAQDGDRAQEDSAAAAADAAEEEGRRKLYEERVGAAAAGLVHVCMREVQEKLEMEALEAVCHRVIGEVVCSVMGEKPRGANVSPTSNVCIQVQSAEAPDDLQQTRDAGSEPAQRQESSQGHAADSQVSSLSGADAPVAQPQTPARPRTPVDRLHVDERMFNQTPVCLDPGPQFQTQRLYSSDRTYVVADRTCDAEASAGAPPTLADEHASSAAVQEDDVEAKASAVTEADVRTAVTDARDEPVQASHESAHSVDALVAQPQTPARPRTPVERLHVDERMFNQTPVCLDPGPQFQTQRLYSSDRTYVVADRTCGADARVGDKSAGAPGSAPTFADEHATGAAVQEDDFERSQEMQQAQMVISNAVVEFALAEARQELVRELQQSLVTQNVVGLCVQCMCSGISCRKHVTLHNPVLANVSRTGAMLTGALHTRQVESIYQIADELQQQGPSDDADAADGDMMELLQEGARLLQQLPPDAVAQVELPLRRPQSPVAQVLHAQIAQMRSDEDAQQVVPAQQSMGDEHRAPAAAAQDDAAEVAAVSDAVVSMVIAEAREELEHRAPAAAFRTLACTQILPLEVSPSKLFCL